MNKPFYVSKGVIGGLLVMVGAIGSAVLNGGVSMDSIQMFGIGLAALGIRVAL